MAFAVKCGERCVGVDDDDEVTGGGRAPAHSDAIIAMFSQNSRTGGREGVGILAEWGLL